VLFGGSASYGATSGGRLALGGWLDCEGTVGLEGSGFLLERRSGGFNVASDAAGDPPLYVPVYRADFGRDGYYIDAFPRLAINGGVDVSSRMRLWGAEANGVFNACRCNNLSVDLLAGFRYADLAERLSIETNSEFSSSEFLNEFSFETHDVFSTRNQFYGGQAGCRAALQYGRVSLELAGKLALGTNHERVSINGTTTIAADGLPNPLTFPGGIFAQPSNIGTTTRNQFA